MTAFFSFLPLKEAVMRFITTEGGFSASYLLTDDDVMKLNVVCEILRPFHSVCMAAQDARGSTQCSVPHWLWGLRSVGQLQSLGRVLISLI